MEDSQWDVTLVKMADREFNQYLLRFLRLGLRSWRGPSITSCCWTYYHSLKRYRCYTAIIARFENVIKRGHRAISENSKLTGPYRLPGFLTNNKLDANLVETAWIWVIFFLELYGSRWLAIWKGGGRNFERPNLKRPIFRNSQIAMLKVTRSSYSIF